MTRASSALSASKLLVLGILQQDGTATAARLAADLRIQPQSLTRLLAGLEADGLIRRRLDPADRRQSLIELTGTGGAALAADLRMRRDRLADAIQRALTPAECEMLGVATSLMDQVTAAIEPEEDRRAAPVHAVE
jgi:DNA-binding MarR family transcriptional regulator